MEPVRVRLLKFATDAKRFVVVAFVVVPYVARKFGNVEFVVVVAVKYAPTISPATDNLAYGELVPMPTRLFKLST